MAAVRRSRRIEVKGEAGSTASKADRVGRARELVGQDVRCDGCIVGGGDQLARQAGQPEPGRVATAASSAATSPGRASVIAAIGSL
jgi:hypothetical protein